MAKINFVILFIFLIVRIDGIDEDLFDDLWKNLKPSTSKNYKKQKIGEINAIQKETVDMNEINEQQNDDKIIIKSENCNENEMEEKKPKILHKSKKESFTKVPKIELDQLSEESFVNEFDQQGDHNVLSADQSNSADDKDYRDSEFEKRNEMETVNKFNLMKMELRRENVYKNMSDVKFEEEIAKKFGTNRRNIYKLKKKLGQIRKYTVNTVTVKDNKQTMRELIRKFDQSRKEKIPGFKYDKKQISKIENEISNELGTNRVQIYKLKKEFRKENDLTKNLQKYQKIDQFERVKEEFTKKFNLKTNWKIDKKIAEKIGVKFNTIYKWKRKFGVIQREKKIYTDAEKLDFVKRSEEMKKRNPMISERKIAEKFGIPNNCLNRWKKKFGSKS